MWFPKNKGLAVGISVMGFGLGSTLASPIINNLLQYCSLTETFLLMGILYAFFLIIGISWLEKPKNYPIKSSEKNKKFKYKKIISNPIFISLWVMFFCNIHCGLATISYATDILNAYNAKATIIPIVISVMGIFNGLGRISFSTISDRLENRGFIFVGIALIPLLTMIPLESLGSAGICILLCLIAMVYGAGFACIAPLLSEIFGMSNISKIHGLVLSAWGIAGLTGNLSMTFFKNLGFAIPQIFWIIFILYICEFILASIITLTLKEKNDNIVVSKEVER
jgi:OFA family oxalate/formate antiporter-like MFS transporter